MLPPGLQIWLARWTEVSELLEDDLMTREEVGTMFQALPKAKGRGSSSSAPAIDAKGFLEFSRKVRLDDTSRLYVFWCFVSCPLIGQIASRHALHSHKQRDCSFSPSFFAICRHTFLTVSHPVTTTEDVVALPSRTIFQRGMPALTAVCNLLEDYLKCLPL